MTTVDYSGLEHDAIIDASPDAVLLVDTDGIIRFANARVRDILGYNPDDLVGDPVERLVPEDVRERHVALREEYTRDPETRPMGVGIDLVARRRDGSEIPVEVALSPVDDAGSGVIAVVRDVADREAARAKYRTILEAVPDAVVVADADSGEIVEANRQVRGLLGYEPDDLVGRPQTTLHPAGEASSYRRLFERHVEAGRTIMTQLPNGDDIEVVTRDGDRVPVEINAHVFEYRDRRLIAGVFRDLSDRRRREDALERLHSASRDLMTAASGTEVAEIASRTATRVLDLPMNGVHLYDPGSSALEPVSWSPAAESVFDGAPPAIPAGEGLAWRAYERGEPEIHRDVREAEDILNTETPFLSELHLPLGEHGVLLVSSTEADDFDATEAALARILAANVEVALDRVDREEELRRQNRQLDEFAGIVSHDLRNPLNVADGYLSLAKDECESLHLDEVERAHRRMEALIGDLLTLAREGQSVADTERLPLSRVVDRCWRNVATRDAELVNDANGVILGDGSRVQQLLENLFRNAVEHAGADVTVTVGDLAEGFYVADDGPGIPEAERDAVFEPGYSTGDTGTGLGLSIVRRIAEAHGWTVGVSTPDAGGTRFEITGVETAG